MPALPFLRNSRERYLTLGKFWRLPLPFSPTFKVPYSSLASHTWVIGRSGRGKSKALENMVYQHIRNGVGCGVIDPHGTLIDDLLRHLITRGVLDNPEVRRRIVYVDPTRKDFIIPFNVLATQDEPYKVVSAILESFRRTFPTLREAPHFENLMTHALLLLIITKKTLMDLTRLLVDQDYREQLLQEAREPDISAFFYQRFEKWGREAPMMRESTLNKVTALSINPYLKLMLGQKVNNLDLKATMDEGKIFLLNLGHLDTDTNRLLGSLIMTHFELAMFRRENTNLYPLTIDEFASYMANDGSVTTLAHILSQARKFGLGLCISHQTLSQLTPKMLGALGNTDTRMVFGVDREDAEHFVKRIGRVNTEAIKQTQLHTMSQTLRSTHETEGQHEAFSTLPEQWEKWCERLQFQPKRQAYVSTGDSVAVPVFTMPVPPYTATEEQVENILRESGQNYGIPYAQARKNLETASVQYHQNATAPMSDPL